MLNESPQNENFTFYFLMASLILLSSLYFLTLLGK